MSSLSFSQLARRLPLDQIATPQPASLTYNPNSGLISFRAGPGTSPADYEMRFTPAEPGTFPIVDLPTSATVANSVASFPAYRGVGIYEVRRKAGGTLGPSEFKRIGAAAVPPPEPSTQDTFTDTYTDTF